MQAPQQRQKTPDKLFYKIGEVSDIAKVESYVLRYWESEFPFLTPRKNKSGQRVYTRKDVELILQIKKLLYQEKYTIAGVKKKFSGASGEKGSVSRETIVGIRKKLKAILKSLK
ncbi:merR family regulatory protein [bacterium BMS3Abin10]|nr:merR family regulatory protein [bacterium BMS3Abin10]GBE38774.1 merR family regulatory protein [bacterium BMS3Bbin08]HDH51394.1 MerR family transcriptional regulator [Nitrospirota bacterium]HDK17578.1 MerR family transcriptional regulator [Nitrospirota bacterium]